MRDTNFSWRDSVLHGHEQQGAVIGEFPALGEPVQIRREELKELLGCEAATKLKCLRQSLDLIHVLRGIFALGNAVRIKKDAVPALECEFAGRNGFQIHKQQRACPLTVQLADVTLSQQQRWEMPTAGSAYLE